MNIPFLDELEFLAERVYNRTLGRIINYDHNGLMLFGYTFATRQSVEEIFSTETSDNLREGLTEEEFQELHAMLDQISALPRPGLPHGMFTERQKSEHGITLIANRIYMFRVHS